MIREALICSVAVIASLALLDAPAAVRDFGDDFDSGIGSAWAVRQQENGTVDTVAVAGRRGKTMRARAQARRDRVTRAALIAPAMPMRVGDTVTIAFDLNVPAPTALTSLHLLDLECATCGEGGDADVRLSLRRGRLRIDRPKIGIGSAWARDGSPALVNNRWYRVSMTVRIGAAGSANVSVDGRRVLSGKGATILPGTDHADRIRIGITANASATPATVLVDNVRMKVS